MLKLDKLILKSFIGPFLLTTALATFILLIQYMLKYFDDFVGKDLGFDVFAELIFYFSLNMLQVALPLGVLVSSLMTFGNLGENFELTAIKSAGLSLIRVLLPVFYFVIVLAIGAFFFNNHIVPSANLKAFSLLYDIKKKKPGLDIKEGVFYGGIPDYNIKVKEKLPDGKTLKDVIIYDHTDGSGNNRVILADSSKMFTMYGDRYLKLELYNGNYYSDEETRRRSDVNRLTRTKFDQMDIVFNLSSFDLKRTKEELFQNNRQMKNIAELTSDIDSLNESVWISKYEFIERMGGFRYHLVDKVSVMLDYFGKKIEQDTLSEEKDTEKTPLTISDSIAKVQMETMDPTNRPDGRLGKLITERSASTFIDKEGLGDEPLNGTAGEIPKPEEPKVLVDTLSWAFLDSAVSRRNREVFLTAKNQAQKIKVNLNSMASRVDILTHDINKFQIEKYKKYSQAVACIVMFLIGAPLGAIIKKGGLGVPVIISIFFFIIYYVLTIMTEKWAKEGLYNPVIAVWTADIVLFPIGLFFLRQARIDARLFDSDIYTIWLEKFLARFKKS